MGSVNKFLDSMVLFKRGQAVWLPILPVGTAVALIHITSLPATDILASIRSGLAEGNPLGSVSAVWLGLVLGGLYINNIHALVARAYLYRTNRYRRVVVSSVLYLGIAMILMVGVLRQNVNAELGLVALAAALLMSLIVLLGIGWRLPDYTAKLLRLPYPDYADARERFNQFEVISKRISRQEQPPARLVDECLDRLREAREELAAQRSAETAWGLEQLNAVVQSIDDFLDLFEARFIDDTDKLKGFNPRHVAGAFRGESKTVFPGVHEQLRNLWRLNDLTSA